MWLAREVYDWAADFKFRSLPESEIMSDRPGQGCLGTDFWPPPAFKGSYQAVTLFSRYPRSANVGAGGKGITTTQMLCPGPDGPAPTLRFELMREGIQEAEARIFLEQRLKETPCRLSAELAARAQAVLDERAKRARLQMSDVDGGGLFRSALTVPYSGWQGRTLRLYEAAAEAAKSGGL